MARRFLPALILLCFACAAFAQPARVLRVSPDPQRRPGMPPRDRGAEPVKGTASISGRVTAADTGAPLRRARVSVSGQELRGSRSALTDPEGRFFIGELPAGSYSLFATRGGYVQTPYGRRSGGLGGKSITLHDGQKLENVDVALQRGGVITGFVSDEYGEPIADAEIRVLQLRWFNGRRRPVPAGRPGMTNDRGEFRVWGLPPGQYIVAASADHFAFDAAAGGEKSGYAPTYFPGTPVLDEAQHMSVSAGQEAAGVSFALTPTRTVRISGLALGTDGKPMTDGGVSVMPRGGGGGGPMMFGGAMGGRIDADGSFTLSGVPPGEYTIQAHGFGRAGLERGEVAFATVTVGTEDIRNLVLVATKGVRMTGRITFEGAPPAGTQEKLRVFAPLPDPALISGPSGDGRVSAEGAFELGNLQPGRRRLMVMGLPAGWDVKEVRTVAGVDVTDSGIDVGKEDVTGLEIRITNRLTAVIGSVRDDRNQPVESYVVLLFSTDPAHWQQIGPRRVNVGRPDQNGVYRVRGLAPGAYYAVAVPELPDEWGNPELMERLEPLAERFTLAEGESRSLDLTLKP